MLKSFRVFASRRAAVWRAAVAHGGALAVLIVVVGVALIDGPGRGFDAYAYWSVDLADLYSGSYSAPGFFPYSPAAALVAQLFSLLPWPIFLLLWQALLVAIVLWFGRGWPWLLALPPVVSEVINGNIHLLLAAAIVVGFRYPWAWSFLFLTKVTPGVALLWFALRREWHSLAIALITTAAIAAATFVFLPAQWHGWLLFLADSGYEPPGVPLWLRLVAAVALVTWGALTNRRWTVPVAAMLALPVVWLASFSMMAGAAALAIRDRKAKTGSTA